jgi:competence protein ComEC
MLLITISANIVLIPIMLYHYNTLSFTFLISNLLAAPIMGILVLLGFITIIVSFIFQPIGKLFSIPLKLFLKIFLQIATLTSNLPFSQIYCATPKILVIILYYVIIAILLFLRKINENPRKRKIENKILNKANKITKKKIVAIVLIIIIVFLFYKQIPQNFKIYFIDVGQGDSMLIITPKGKTMLVDGGGTRDTESFDVGTSTLMPYLLDRGITKLDYMLISHFDSDHVRSDFLLF